MSKSVRPKIQNKVIMIGDKSIYKAIRSAVNRGYINGQIPIPGNRDSNQAIAARAFNKLSKEFS